MTTKKPTPRKSAKTPKPTATRRVAQPIAGEPEEPVTLEEAQAIVRAMAPRRALARAASKPIATPADVGQARRDLNEERRRENERRIQEYTDIMTLMKQRGVKGLGEKRGPARATASAASRQPLQVFAEGDSWFKYPPFLLKGGIIPRLQKLLGVPILNLAKAGDEVRYMLGVEQRKILIQQLRAGCPAGGLWDVLLFSGGGNDVVDNPMALWVRDFVAGASPAELINQPRYDAVLALVRAGYEDLIELRDALSPNTRLVFHAYDFAIPDGRGVCFLGPWLKPTFELRGFPTDPSAAFEVVRAMLQQFADLLKSLETNHAGVTFINAQGTLVPETSSWHNELHPSSDGFSEFAGIFHQKLKALFPNRVP